MPVAVVSRSISRHDEKALVSETFRDFFCEDFNSHSIDQLKILGLSIFFMQSSIA